MNINHLTKILDSKKAPENPKGDRESVIRATFRPESTETLVRTAKDVLRGNEDLKQFLQLKETF